MRSTFTGWAGVAAAPIVPDSIPWYAWVGVVLVGFVVTLISVVLDYRLRLRAIDKVPATRVPEVMPTTWAGSWNRRQEPEPSA